MSTRQSLAGFGGEKAHPRPCRWLCAEITGRHSRCERLKLLVPSPLLKGKDPRADWEPEVGSSGPQGPHRHAVVSPVPDGGAALALSR